MDKMLSGLFAIRDDVDPGVFLQFEPEQGRIALRGDQICALCTPLRPQLMRFGEPRGLRQAAGDGGAIQGNLLSFFYAEGATCPAVASIRVI